MPSTAPISRAYQSALSLHVVGHALHRRGDLDGALAHYVAALGDPDDETTPHCASVMTAIGQLLYERNEYDQSLLYIERALGLKRRHYGLAHPFVGHTEFYRARSQIALNLAEEARLSLQRACAIHLSSLGTENLWTGRSHQALGELLHQAGDHRSAQECYDLALGAYEASLGPSHPKTGAVHRARAVLAYQLGDNVEADAHYVQAYMVRASAEGSIDPTAVAWLQELALNRAAMSDYEGARAAFEQCLAAWYETKGAEHLEVADLLCHIGQVEVSRRRQAEALLVYVKAHGIRQRLLGPEHPATATARFHCGMSLWSSGDPWGLLEMGDAVGELERLLGTEHPDTQAARSWLARCG